MTTPEPRPTPVKKPQTTPTATVMMNDPAIDYVDFRVFVDASSYETLEEILDAVSDALQQHPALAAMIAAYQLVNDGFGNITAAPDPIA